MGNVLYTQGHKDGKQWVMALDVNNKGKLIWEADFGPVRHEGAGKPGSRSVPTIDGDRLYTTGIAGEVVCMDIKDGKIIWQKDFVKDFGGKAPMWGYAESVLVDGPWVVCTPGGEKNTIAALDKSNGEKVWGAAVGDPAGYASVIKATIDGRGTIHQSYGQRRYCRSGPKTANFSGATTPRQIKWPTARLASSREIRSLPPPVTISAAGGSI